MMKKIMLGLMISMSLSLCAMEEKTNLQVLANVLGEEKKTVLLTQVHSKRFLRSILEDRRESRLDNVESVVITKEVLDDIFKNKDKIENAVSYFQENDVKSPFEYDILNAVRSNVTIMKNEEEKKRSAYHWRTLRSFLQGIGGGLLAGIGIKAFLNNDDNKYLGASGIFAGGINIYYGVKNCYNHVNKVAEKDKKYRMYGQWLDMLKELQLWSDLSKLNDAVQSEYGEGK